MSDCSNPSLEAASPELLFEPNLARLDDVPADEDDRILEPFSAPLLGTYPPGTKAGEIEKTMRIMYLNQPV